MRPQPDQYLFYLNSGKLTMMCPHGLTCWNIQMKKAGEKLLRLLSMMMIRTLMKPLIIKLKVNYCCLFVYLYIPAIRRACFYCFFSLSRITSRLTRDCIDSRPTEY